MLKSATGSKKGDSAFSRPTNRLKRRPFIGIGRSRNTPNSVIAFKRTKTRCMLPLIPQPVDLQRSRSSLNRQRNRLMSNHARIEISHQRQYCLHNVIIESLERPACLDPRYNLTKVLLSW